MYSYIAFSLKNTYADVLCAGIGSPARYFCDYNFPYILLFCAALLFFSALLLKLLPIQILGSKANQNHAWNEGRMEERSSPYNTIRLV
jgi:hypothetical protein